MRLKEFFSYHHVTGNPQTVLTKQRKSLKEPLKVFTLLSHQDCGLWMPDAGWLAGACPCHHPLSAPGYLSPWPGADCLLARDPLLATRY